MAGIVDPRILETMELAYEQWRAIKRGYSRNFDFERPVATDEPTPRTNSNALREFFDSRKAGTGYLEMEPLFRYLRPPLSSISWTGSSCS